SLIMYGPKPHGRKLPAAAVLYSGWKLNGLPLHVVGSVFMKPFLAEAIMKPLWCVVRSVSLASKAWPPGTRALNICTAMSSPWFIISVCAFGVSVELSLSCGLGGPAGTPLVAMNAKFTGSVQFGLQGSGFIPLPWHSRLSMVRAEHQCVSSQLVLSRKGAAPGG